MDIENIVKNNESVEGQTYQKGLLDNLGTITENKGHGPVEVTSNSFTIKTAQMNVILPTCSIQNRRPKLGIFHQSPQLGFTTENNGKLAQI